MLILEKINEEELMQDTENILTDLDYLKVI